MNSTPYARRPQMREQHATRTRAMKAMEMVPTVAQRQHHAGCALHHGAHRPPYDLGQLSSGGHGMDPRLYACTQGGGPPESAHGRTQTRAPSGHAICARRATHTRHRGAAPVPRLPSNCRALQPLLRRPPGCSLRCGRMRPLKRGLQGHPRTPHYCCLQSGAGRAGRQMRLPAGTWPLRRPHCQQRVPEPEEAQARCLMRCPKRAQQQARRACAARPRGTPTQRRPCSAHASSCRCS